MRASVGIHTTIILIVTGSFLAAMLAYSFRTIQKKMIRSMAVGALSLRFHLIVNDIDEDQ